MNTGRLHRSKETASRIPFPKLPLPAKFQKIPKAQPEPEPEPEPEEIVEQVIAKPLAKPKPAKTKKKRKPVGNINVAEPIIGGDLEPEPPQKHDAGDYVVEEINYSDYK